MTELPKISVIIATKNSARFLNCALESVLKADYAHLEILVVDQQSVDSTIEILGNFSQKNKDKEIFHIEQWGHGLYNAWNLALDKATGDFIAFLDSDDFWEEGRLRIAIRYLIEHPKELYVVSHFRFFLENGCKVPDGFNSDLFNASHLGRIPGTLLARKEAFEKVGKFDENFGIAGDVDWFARAKDIGLAWGVLPDVLLNKRIHESNLSSYAERNTKELLKLLHNSIKRGL